MNIGCQLAVRTEHDPVIMSRMTRVRVGKDHLDA